MIPWMDEYCLLVILFMVLDDFSDIWVLLTGDPGDGG